MHGQPGLPFTLRGDGGCNGRNEICSAGASPCSSALNLSACENLCYSDNACLSFEWKASGSSCQLSTTCTNSIRVADNQGSNGWVMYERTGVRACVRAARTLGLAPSSTQPRPRTLKARSSDPALSTLHPRPRTLEPATSIWHSQARTLEARRLDLAVCTLDPAPSSP